MQFKTLLLGSAAAFAVAGSAQAADLAVAESVEYVKVCDAYGAGYFYVPGSDVCLKIGGFVELRTHFYDTSKSLNAVGNSSLVGGGVTVLTPGSPDYFASWDFFTRTSINFTAKWMTDWGAATVYVDYRSDTTAASGSSTKAYLDTGYLKIGGLKAGWDASTYDWGFNGLIDNLSSFDHDLHQQQLQWSTTFAGLGFFLGIEDPRDNIGGSGYYTGDLPDLVVALTGSSGAFSWKWSAAASDTIYGTGWGTQLGVGWASGGNFVKVQAAVSDDAGAMYGAGLVPKSTGQTYWHVTGQAGISWTSAFQTIFGVGYRSGLQTAGDAGASAGFSFPGATNEWEAEAEADWTIAKGVQAGLDVYFRDPNVGASVTTVEARVHAGF